MSLVSQFTLPYILSINQVIFFSRMIKCSCFRLLSCLVTFSLEAWSSFEVWKSTETYQLFLILTKYFKIFHVGMTLKLSLTGCHDNMGSVPWKGIWVWSYLMLSWQYDNWLHEWGVTLPVKLVLGWLEIYWKNIYIYVQNIYTLYIYIFRIYTYNIRESLAVLKKAQKK